MPKVSSGLLSQALMSRLEAQWLSHSCENVAVYLSVHLLPSTSSFSLVVASLWKILGFPSLSVWIRQPALPPSQADWPIPLQPHWPCQYCLSLWFLSSLKTQPSLSVLHSPQGLVMVHVLQSLFNEQLCGSLKVPLFRTTQICFVLTQTCHKQAGKITWWLMSACCSFEGPMLRSRHPCQMAYNCLPLQFQRSEALWTPMAPVCTWRT